MKFRPILILTLGAATLGFGIVRGAPQEPAATPPGAMMPVLSAETQTCAECHEEQATSAHVGPHAVLELPETAARYELSSSCAGCHGDVSAHLDEPDAGNVFAFKDDDLPGVKSSRCLDCHGDDHPRFPASRHAAAGIDCASCHSVHAPGDRLTLMATAGGAFGDRFDRASATCAECHGEVFTRFEFNEHHRLEEGILSCVTCHDPHAPQSRLALGGFKQQQCGQCHADKLGPFVYEHGSSRVEGCIACHEPHGAPSRHQLTFQRVAELCYSCHAAVPGFHARFTLDSQCTSCHSSIHGSNFDPAFLK